MRLKNLEENLTLQKFLNNVIEFRLYVEDNRMTLKISSLVNYMYGFAFL